MSQRPMEASDCLRVADTRDEHGQRQSKLVKKARALLALVMRTGRSRLGEEGHNERAPFASLRGGDFDSSYASSGGSNSSSSSRTSNHALSVTCESGQSNALFDLVPEYKEMDCR